MKRSIRKLKILIYLTIPFQVLLSQNLKKETVLDNVIYIEDSIYNSIPSLPRLCDNITSLNKSHVDIGGTKLYTEIEGEGIPIILINGGPGGTHHYFHPWFSKLKERHKIIYYDQRGTGLSDFNPESGYTIKQAVEDLERLRIKLKISKWIVFGYSYGGALAQYYAIKYPENILALLLCSSHPVFKSEKFKSQQQKYISTQEKERMDAITQKALEDKRNGKLNVQAYLYNVALNGDWKRQNFYKPTKEEMIRSVLYEWTNDRSFNRDVSKSMRHLDFRGAFKNCPIPTLIFEGKQDLTWGDKKPEVFKANHPNAKYAYFKNSGHKIFKDEPKKFNRTLLNFTRKNKASTAKSIKKWKETTNKYIQE
ncbi:alpha/beta fold hydrolase [Polaribacter porphyrae]|uniref:AB hydrolase-1 domain-containing protein n=1 Tax=Polaribacter porphyrae TaxID=1137780 RepID=A0A2S7WQZ5_9FLAO|nr:alpha/beta hydrolase [Polaribacter porphyrae]PQJ79866.1 hypothetical protein BTO18_12080 [Polaribacter porphyrae]